jgi:hypothetical protein
MASTVMARSAVGVITIPMPTRHRDFELFDGYDIFIATLRPDFVFMQRALAGSLAPCR